MRLLVDHRERLVGQRTALINDLRWGLHDLWPELEIPPRALTGRGWLDRVAGRLTRSEQTARVRIARDELRRIRELTRAIDLLEAELAVLVSALAPRLLAERGCGVLIAAKLIGEAIEAADVAKPARIYDLRATFASDALAAGVGIFTLARIIGTSVRMIERHYGALLDGAGAGIAGALDALDAERDLAPDRAGDDR